LNFFNHKIKIFFILFDKNKNNRKLDIWKDEDLNTISGTIGIISTPFKSREDTYYSYAPDLCRYFSFSIRFYLKNI